MRALHELVSLPLKAPQLFARYSIRPPRGVLLWGPPGCGKTCLARAAAAEAGCPLLVLNGPDVVSEFYGESEAGLQGALAMLTQPMSGLVLHVTQSSSRPHSHRAGE